MTNWLNFALLGRLILGSSAVADKILLKKSFPNPWGYTFWLTIIGLASVFLLPFGFTRSSGEIIALALLGGALFTFAILFYFLALFEGEASRALILIGALTPIFTVILSSFALGKNLNTLEIAAFFILSIGGATLFLTEEKHLRLKMFYLAVASALLLSIVSVVSKIIFLSTNFVTGFFWIKIGAAAVALLFLVPKNLRKKILRSRSEIKFKHKTAYVLNRALAGLGSFAVNYSLVLGPPSLVDATVNLEYVFIFLGGWLILKEKFHGHALFGKITAVVAIVFGTTILGINNYLANNSPAPLRQVTWGVTFSQKFSESMGLDWKENYKAILDDLGIKNLRLVAYWDKVEPQNGTFDFSDLDWQMQSAEKAGGKVILAVGQKVPRWPECYFPGWTNDLNDKELKMVVFDYISRTVERYKNSPALRYWQIENEPFLPFGICPRFNSDLLDEEIGLVKKIDPAHPVLISDSGELSIWFVSASKGDVFGTSIYRKVQNKIFGYIQYPLTPEFFRFKEQFSRFITRDYKKRYIVVELGAEPWLDKALRSATLDEQFRAFDLDFFRSTIEYAKAAGFDEYYLWGAEWWWWLKKTQNHPEFWDFAKAVVKLAR